MPILKKKKINIPIYDQFVLTIFLSDTIEDDVSKITKTKFDYTFGGMFFYKGNDPTNLFIAIDKDSLSDSIIAHECFHATKHILEYVGISLDDSSEEAYAYLIGYLVDQISRIIK